MGSDSLLEAIRSRVVDLGFELIEFRKSGPPQRPSIQVRIDRPDSRPGAGVTADDCARVSRALEKWFEGEGGVGRRYLLQVSSPGFERPVRFPEHWRRYVGRTVRVTARTLSGHPRAVIVAVPDDAQVRLRLPDGAETLVALADVKEALLQEIDDSAADRRRGP
jgi:ribosome maturation factor RimP